MGAPQLIDTGMSADEGNLSLLERFISIPSRYIKLFYSGSFSRMVGYGENFL